VCLLTVFGKTTLFLDLSNGHRVDTVTVCVPIELILQTTKQKQNYYLFCISTFSQLFLFNLECILGKN